MCLSYKRFLFARYSVLTVLFIAWACVHCVLALCFQCLSLLRFASSCVCEHISVCMYSSMCECVCILLSLVCSVYTCVCWERSNETIEIALARFFMFFWIFERYKTTARTAQIQKQKYKTYREEQQLHSETEREKAREMPQHRETPKKRVPTCIHTWKYTHSIHMPLKF